MAIRKAETGDKGRRLRKSGLVGLSNTIFYVKKAGNPTYWTICASSPAL